MASGKSSVLARRFGRVGPLAGGFLSLILIFGLTACGETLYEPGTLPDDTTGGPIEPPPTGGLPGVAIEVQAPSRIEITDSIVGIRAVVQKGTTLDRTILMGANHFESLDEIRSHDIPIGVGRDCQIRNAIIDFNARIGDGCRLINEGAIQDADADSWSIRDGIIVVPKDATIPPGTVI